MPELRECGGAEDRQRLQAGGALIPKLKKTLNFRVKDARYAIKLFQALSEMDLDVVADSRQGVVKIRIYGSREEIESAARKIAALAGGSKEV